MYCDYLIIQGKSGTRWNEISEIAISAYHFDHLRRIVKDRVWSMPYAGNPPPSGRKIYRAKENHWKSIIFVAELNTLQLPSQSAKMFRMNKNAYSTIKPQNEPYIPQRQESCSPYQMYFATKIILIHHHNRILTKELVIKSIYRICTVLKTIPVTQALNNPDKADLYLRNNSATKIILLASTWTATSGASWILKSFYHSTTLPFYLCVIAAFLSFHPADIPVNQTITKCIQSAAADLIDFYLSIYVE